MATSFDLTTATLAGANSSVCTVDSPTQYTVTNVATDHEAYLYVDLGASGIFGNWAFRFSCNVSSSAGDEAAEFLGISDSVGAWTGATRDGLSLYWSDASSVNTFKILTSSGSDTSSSVSTATNYFITVKRSGSTVTATIRTGSHTGTVVDTISQTRSGDFRYLYFFSSQNGGGKGDVDLDFVNQNYENIRPTGSLSKTLSPASLEAINVLGSVGFLTATLAPATLEAINVPGSVGTLTATLAPATLQSLDADGVVGVLSATLEPAFMANVAAGIFEATLAPASLAATGGKPILTYTPRMGLFYDQLFE